MLSSGWRLAQNDIAPRFEEAVRVYEVRWTEDA